MNPIDLLNDSKVGGATVLCVLRAFEMERLPTDRTWLSKCLKKQAGPFIVPVINLNPPGRRL